MNVGYPSNPLKNYTFFPLILNFWPTFKDSMQARHPQFVHVQYIKDLRMHAKIGEVVVETYFMGGR